MPLSVPKDYRCFLDDIMDALKDKAERLIPYYSMHHVLEDIRQDQIEEQEAPSEGSFAYTVETCVENLFSILCVAVILILWMLYVPTVLFRILWHNVHPDVTNEK